MKFKKIIKRIFGLRKKFFIGFILFFVIFLIFLGKIIPAYIYNNYEYKIRTRYYEAERMREAINIMIGIKGGLTDYLITDQKRAKVPEELEKAVKTREELIKEIIKYNDRQTKIPFLPKKYKEYHQLKTSGLNHYQNSFNSFKTSYEDMNKVFVLWKKLDDLRFLFANGIINLRTDPKAEEKIKNVILAKEIIKESDEFLKKGILDKDLNTYFNFESQKLLDAYDYYLKSKEKQFTDFSWNDMTKIISRQSGLPEVETLAVNWKENCFGKILREREEENKLADEEIIEADRYYKDNKLNNDLISRAFAKFFNKFPRIN